jgi:hypothetical protein
VGAVLLGPVIWLYRENLRSGPIYFRYKGKQLWAKIRNADYKVLFLTLNEDDIIEDNSSQDEVLDQD